MKQLKQLQRGNEKKIELPPTSIGVTADYFVQPIM